MANDASKSLSLKVLVDEEKNRVVYAESDNDFMDVLLSFITIPIGTIIRLTHEEAWKWEIGCLNNLNKSIENLDNKHLQSEKCKDMLLYPQSATEIYCKNLKLNYVNSTINEYFACSRKCILYPYETARCHCGSRIDSIAKLKNPPCVPPDGEVFVKPTSRFMITDDFRVLPVSTMTSLMLLKELGAVNGSTLKERCIKIGKDEVLKLLKCSLTSTAPFSETVLESPANRTGFAIRRGEFSSRRTNESETAMDTTREEAKMALKLIIDKCHNRVVYAEAEKDFVDLICSILTLPLGYVFQIFPSLSLMGCLGNLYKSIKVFDGNKYFKSEEMKATLVDPKLAPGIGYNKQILPTKEVLYPSHSSVSSLFKRKSGYVDATVSGEGFMKGQSMFTVTDNLTITPLSLISGLTLINILNLPISDIIEQEVTVGEEEAALVSEALSDAFILKDSTDKPFSHLDARTESKLNRMQL